MSDNGIRRLLSVFDQSIQALANLVTTVLLARLLPIDEFAVVATTLTVWFLVEALQRTGILVPYFAQGPSEDQGATNTMWLLLLVCFLGVSGLAFLAVGSSVPGAVGAALLLSGGLVPAAGLFHYGKRLLYHFGHPWQALFTSAVNAAILIAFLTLIAFGFLAADAQSATTAYIASYSGALVIPAIPARSHFGKPGGQRSALLHQLPNIAKMSLGGVAAYFYNNGVQFIVAVTAVLAEAAAFSATRVLSRPSSVILASIADVERSAAARLYNSKGPVELDRFLRKLSFLLCALVIPSGAILVLLTPFLINFLFDGKYDDYTLAGQMWIVALIPQLLAVPLDISLSVRLQANHLLIARLAGAAGCLALVVGLYWLDSSLTAMEGIIGVMAGRSVTLVVMMLTWRQSLRRAS